VALARKQVVDAPVAEAPTQVRQLDDPGTEVLARYVHAGWLAIAGPGQPRIAAGAAFADVELLDHLAGGFTPGLRG